MATFDIEHRIANRQRELEDDRRRRLARRGVEEADIFSRPRPLFIEPNSGQIPDSAFRGPDFRNVEGQADTVPTGAPEQTGMPRRSAPDTPAAPSGPPDRRQPLPTERKQALEERQKRLKDVDDAIFDVTYRRGGLNMASKRRLFGDLVGQRNDLTMDFYRGENARGMQNAQQQGQASQTNAELGERAAQRRDRAAQFNTELGDRRFEYDTSRRDASQLSPKELLELEKLRTEIDVNKADATRVADEYTRKAPGIGDDVLAKRIVELQAANPGMSYKDASTRAVAAYKASGADAEASTIGADLRNQLTQRLAEGFDYEKIPVLDWRTIGDEAAIGSRWADNQIAPGAITDPLAVKGERLGALRRFFTPNADYRFEVQGPNGPRAVYSDDEELFKDLQNYRQTFGRR